MRRSAALVLLVARIAHADEATELHEDSTVPEALTRDPHAPLLSLDPFLRSNVEGFEADVKTERKDFALGPNTRARIESEAWTNPMLGGAGWGATARLAYNFHGLQFGFEAGYHRVDGQLTHGGYRFLGFSIAKTFKLSKWMTAWISLTVGQRQWLGDRGPPTGETNDTSAMLSIGTTFR